MANGKVFGTSGEVNSLANVINMCMQAIEASNQKGKTLLSSIDGSESDAVYQNAQEIVDYVTKAVGIAREPLESVTSALKSYAELLESHGK